MPSSNTEKNVVACFHARDEEAFWSYLEQLLVELQNEHSTACKQVFFDGIIPEIQNWTGSTVVAAGYIWCFAKKGNHQGVRPIRVDLEFRDDLIVEGQLRFGELGTREVDWNSRQKTKWDGFLYPDRFDDLEWDISFTRCNSGWRPKLV